ncbi:TPA: P-loop ATPase, Sll1717 family [Vibrio diabolicus]
MLKLKLNDRSLFGNDAGEDEAQEILNSYFIDNDDFDDFYDDEHRLCVVNARKGMGKSTLLSKLDYDLASKEEYGRPVVVRVTGNSLLGLGDFNGKDPAYLENYWKQIICKEINIHIGKTINFAFTSDDMSMVEISELEGMKSKNLIGGLISRIKGKIPVLGSETQGFKPENLERLLNNYLDDNHDKKVWLLVDDIDAKYIDCEDFQHRISSFFSAIRGLCFDVKNLNIRATVRSDVWTNLRHVEDLDKWDQYIVNIVWTKRQMREMLAKKILSYVQRKHPDSPEAKYKFDRDYNKLFKLIFISPINWAGKEAPVFDAINAFSNHRPRSMGQLCRMAANQAHRSRCKVSLRQFNEILTKFGQNRRDDLIKEHQHQFPELENLIDAFRAGQKEYTFSELEMVLDSKFIKGREVSDIPVIDGKPYCNLIDLGHFVYKIGLISKLPDESQNFTFYTDDPDLFYSQQNRNNELTWSVHPSYRKYLNIN